MATRQPTQIGTLRILEDFPATVDFDRFGATSATMTFTSLWVDAPGATRQRETHPNFSWLIRDSAKITRMEANWAKIEITFRGIPPETDEKFYRVTGATNSEPIETHPDFETFATVGNGALFNSESGAFEGWTPESDFVGIESWFVPNLVFEELWVVANTTQERGIWRTLGEIETPPSSPVRPVVSGRNWLFMGGDVEEWGRGAKIRRRWKQSGPNGWNATIYG